MPTAGCVTLCMCVLRCLGDSPLCPSQRAGDYPPGEERGRGRLPCGQVWLLGMLVEVWC